MIAATAGVEYDINPLVNSQYVASFTNQFWKFARSVFLISTQTDNLNYTRISCKTHYASRARLPTSFPKNIESLSESKRLTQTSKYM